MVVAGGAELVDVVTTVVLGVAVVVGAAVVEALATDVEVTLVAETVVVLGRTVGCGAIDVLVCSGLEFEEDAPSAATVVTGT